MSVFNTISSEKILYQDKYFFLAYDINPVSAGHMLIISQAPKIDFFALSPIEKNALTHAIERAKTIIEKKFAPNGYNIGMNCGASAGQTVMHFHCHIIPRYNNDMNNPRGGVRHCVAGKGDY